MEKFKKGQMVPRRLGLVLATIRKAQHCIKFGCDVEIDGNTVRQLSSGSVFVMPATITRRMKNGTHRKSSVVMKSSVWIHGAWDQIQFDVYQSTRMRTSPQ